MILNPKPLVFAHRGASGYEYENTIPAFEMAYEMGADGLETDAWILADGEVVLHHDKAIEVKQTGEHINISTLNLKELKSLTLPNNTKVPTLREFLEKFAFRTTKAGKPLEFSIDLQDLKVGAAMVPILREFKVIDRVLLCANSMIPLKKVRALDPEVRLVASNQHDQIKPEFFGPTGKFTPTNLYAFNIKGNDFTPEMKENLIKLGLKCFIWDLHHEDCLRKYLAFAPSVIYSNYPDLALKIRAEMFN
jgi:glycerophosphoryl diester phosphodiesterase